MDTCHFAFHIFLKVIGIDWKSLETPVIHRRIMIRFDWI